MAEVHIIGEIASASGFNHSSLFCKWGIHTGGAWKLLSGLREGQTQVDEPATGEEANFCHPVDIHFATRGLQGWPKVWVQVFHQDSLGRNELVGYGFSHIPTSAGCHKIEIATWKPSGSLGDSLSQHFLGGAHQLKTSELIFSSQERYRLTTVAAGKVTANLNLILRNFHKFGIEC